jgi:hypothetical protein
VLLRVPLTNVRQTGNISFNPELRRSGMQNSEKTKIIKGISSQTLGRFLARWFWILRISTFGFRVCGNGYVLALSLVILSMPKTNRQLKAGYDHG